MYSDELWKEGKKHVPGFIGVFAIDDLPKFTTTPKIPFRFIVNTHTRNLPGEHWIAVSCEDSHIALLFDPLGFYYPHQLMHYLTKICTKIYFNKIQYQHPKSRICGQLCLEFLKSLKNLSLSEKVFLMR